MGTGDATFEDLLSVHGPRLDEYIHRCHQDGMTREECEGSIRALFQAQRDVVEDDRVRAHRADTLDWINVVLHKHYGQGAMTPDGICKLLSSSFNATNECGAGCVVWGLLPAGAEVRSAEDVAVAGRSFKAAWAVRCFSLDTLGEMSMTSVMRLPLSACRGQKRVWPVQLAMQKAFVGRRKSENLGSITIGGWTTSGPWDPRLGKTLVEEARFAAGLVVESWRWWTVDLQMGRGPKVQMWMGPHEAKDVFRLREIEDGEKRRAALLHLVRRHHRTKAFTARETIEVREHLRGRESFVWKGITGEIRPPKELDSRLRGVALQESHR